MKRAIIIFAVVLQLVCAAFLAHGLAAEEDFDRQAAAEKAKKKLADGEHLKAAEIYKQLWDNGAKSSDVAYNAGTAYAKAGKIGMAVLFLERAKILSPGDEDAKANLAIVAKKIKRQNSDAAAESGDKTVKSAKAEDDDAGLTLQSALDVLSSDAWAALFIACMWGASLLSITLLFTRTPRNKKRASSALVAAAVLTVVFGSLFYLKAKDDVLTDWGVVIASCEAKEGPHENFPASFKASEGMKAALSEEMEGWRKITSPNGLTGYVKSGDVEKIASF